MKARAREGLYIVSPSSLTPFSKLVIKEITQKNKEKHSTIEIQNSEQAFKAFCSGGGLNTPDIVNADIRIQKDEFNKCAKNGVKDVSEAIIGYDATVLVQNISSKTFNSSKEAFMLALLAKVPRSFLCTKLNMHEYISLCFKIPHIVYLFVM